MQSNPTHTHSLKGSSIPASNLATKIPEYPTKEELLAADYCPVPGLWAKQPLHPEVAAVAAGSFKNLNPPKIRGTGYVVQSLEAALWAFHGTNTFRDGCLAAVNLGDDADTTGAIYGQLAGAFYGEAALPEAWLEPLALRDEIATLAGKLMEGPGG